MTGPRFKPSFRDTLRANNAADAYYAAMSGKEPQAQAEVKPKIGRPRRQYVPSDAVDIDAAHRNESGHRGLEADVIRAVDQLLRVHPRVLWALRMNSGAASYEAATGRYAPVWFHRWVTGSGYRMSDFLGASIDSRIIAIEAKRPGWSKPTDQREREQAAFLELVRKHGGIALFCTDAAQVAEALSA